MKGSWWGLACGQISSQLEYHRLSAFYSHGNGPAMQVTGLRPTILKILLKVPGMIPIAALITWSREIAQTLP